MSEFDGIKQAVLDRVKDVVAQRMDEIGETIRSRYAYQIQTTAREWLEQYGDNIYRYHYRAAQIAASGATVKVDSIFDGLDGGGTISASVECDTEGQPERVVEYVHELLGEASSNFKNGSSKYAFF